MESELEAHAAEGDFAAYHIETDNDALYWLHEHEVKLSRAIFGHDVDGVRKQCAHIANIVMKIEEQFGPGSLQPQTAPLPGITP